MTEASIGEDLENSNPSSFPVRNGTVPVQEASAVSQNVGHSYHTAQDSCGYVSKRTENVSWIQIVIAAVFTMEKKYKQPIYPSLIHKQNVV